MSRSRMMRTGLAVVAAGVLLAIGPGRAAKPARGKTTVDKTFWTKQKYTVRTIEGFRVHVNNDLLTTHKALGDKALKLLATKLYDVTRTVPAKAVTSLRTVHIWIERDNPNGVCAVYHPSAGWLKAHDRNPAKARCVEISNATRFCDWSNTQPSMVLHELAHAYHHQVLTHGNADVQGAFKQAVASKSYEKVLHASGREKRAYALNNQQEYFAELTEAYFGVNDFYPFVRAEVARHDPRMYKALKKVWGAR